MKYLSKRLKQPSTWLGLLGAAAALVASGGQVTPEVLGSLVTSLGLVHIDEVPSGANQASN